MTKEEIKEYKKEYRLKNFDKIKEQNRLWRENNIERVKEHNKKYRETNPYKNRDYFRNNPEKLKLYRQQQEQYYKNNPEKLEEYKKWLKEYSYNYNRKEENKENLKKLQRNYAKKHPYRFAWRGTLRHTLRHFGKKKEDKTINLLGYSAKDLKNHIEKLFVDGMSWDNYGQGFGKWNIDHIKAISNFDPETPVHIVNTLSNLQPLWSLDNISKGNRDIYKNNN